MKSGIAKFWISLCQPFAASVTRHNDWQMKFFILGTFQEELCVTSHLNGMYIRWYQENQFYDVHQRKSECVPDNDERWQTTKSSYEQLETTFGEDNPKRVHCDTDGDSVAKECLPTHPILSFYTMVSENKA